MKPCVFVHTNAKQLLGAKVAAYLLKARSRYAEAFDVKILRLEQTQHLYRREGQRFLRKGRTATWRNDDLQSFSPLRMMVPQEMEFRGRALVIDPDVFAVGDVYELLTRDMGQKAILARWIKEGYRGNGNAYFASSVMLLECSKLTHWRWNEHIDRIFSKSLDYGPWISLMLEDPNAIGELEDEWNHFDTLDKSTKLLHNTERSTQPWKTGLPVDYDTTATNTRPSRVLAKLRRVLRIRQPSPSMRYLPHPDRAQELFFFQAVRECLSAGVFDEDFLRTEMRRNNVRQDLLSRLAELESPPLLAA